MTQAVAAVDLGSNSFHMKVARLEEGRLEVVDRLRERVALAEGLDEHKVLSPAVQERALACLSRFGQRLRDMPATSVRAVGTNTLRVARNARTFLALAQEALGHPIEVVSGREEARLVYLGVIGSLPTNGGTRRLVVDVGGGSTECVIGEGHEVLKVESLYMGCVSFSLAHFRDGRIKKEDMDRARLAAAVELEHMVAPFRALGWKSCVGSSGTVLAIADILRQQGFGDGGITGKGLGKLRSAMIDAGNVARLKLAGLEEERRPVLPGGVAILSALFDDLGIDVMQPATGALREGVLHDLLGRLGHEDVRDHSVAELAARYRADPQQAARVEASALHMLQAMIPSWKLDRGEATRLCSWAARLHEIGLAVSYSGHHRHGAYLIANSELPGFSREDQATLASLVLAHRRKLKGRVFDDLPADRMPLAERVAVALRLGVVLNRSRSSRPVPEADVRVQGRTITLVFPDAFLEQHPLTAADLAEEAERLRLAGYTLVAS